MGYCEGAYNISSNKPRHSSDGVNIGAEHPYNTGIVIDLILVRSRMSADPRESEWVTSNDIAKAGFASAVIVDLTR